MDHDGPSHTAPMSPAGHHQTEQFANGELSSALRRNGSPRARRSGKRERYIDSDTLNILAVRQRRASRSDPGPRLTTEVQLVNDDGEFTWSTVRVSKRGGKNFFMHYLKPNWEGSSWIVSPTNPSTGLKWVMKVFVPNEYNGELKVGTTIKADAGLNPFQRLEDDSLHNGLQRQQGQKRVNENEFSIDDNDEGGQRNLRSSRSRKRARPVVSDAAQDSVDLDTPAIEHLDDAADVASEGARTGHVLVEAAGAVQTIGEPANSGLSGHQEQNDAIVLHQPQLQNALEPVFRFISKRNRPGEPRRYPRHKFKTSMNLRVAAVVEGAATPKTPILEVTINNGPPQPIDIESQEDLDDYVLKPVDALPMHEPKNVWIRGLELGEILA